MKLSDAVRRLSPFRRRRRVRTPVFLQQEASDCGAACLGIVLAHFGYRATLEEMREACGTGRDGCTAGDIVRAASTYGLKTTGWRREPSQLDASPVPSILFWEFNHFVVLEGADRDGFHINDPASGHRTIGAKDFDTAFTGVLLIPEATPEFRQGGQSSGVLRQLWPWFSGHRPSLGLAALYSLFLAASGLALPLLLALFVDQVLIGGQAARSGALIAAAGGVAALVYLLTWLQMRTLRRMGVRMSVEYADRYFTRLLRRPMSFFSRRLAGDLVDRMRLVDGVATVSATQLVSLFADVALGLSFLALMFVFDVPSAVAVAALAILALALARLVRNRRAELSPGFARAQGELAGYVTSGLRRLTQLQATASENRFFSRAAGHQARELKARQEFAELGHVTTALPDFVLILGAAAVFGFGGWRAMNGDMTIGTLVGFYVVAGNFLRPVCQLTQFSDTIQSLEGQLQRLNDVLVVSGDEENPAAAESEGPGVATLAGRVRLAGRIELRDVTFGFQRNRPPLIENFSLTIEPGQRVAIVGSIGSGKSTLASLVAGVHEPWSGEVCFDGVPRRRIPSAVLQNSVSMVDQSPFLFAATVRENLTLWNSAAPDELVVAAARDARIHEEILRRPLGYETPVEEAGRNFSGGERLRLEIARALVNEPSVLVLDEATSGLDVLTEQEIDDALRRRGCSCLIIAHRLSTIRDSDLIVVLDSGRPVQTGSHDELIAVEGLYRDLVGDD